MDASKLNFMTGSRGHRNVSDKDVGVSLHKNDIICFIFRNEVEKDILKIKGQESLAKYIVIAFVEGRLYIKGTNDKEGFLITRNPHCQNAYCKLRSRYATDEFKDWILENEGSYDLRYDSEAGLYYISNEMKFMTRG